MKSTRLFRWGLVGVLVLSLAGVVWSFLSRRATGGPAPEADLLPREVSRRTTQFEYTEHKKGRPVYTVYADTSTQTIDQLHTLSQVRLVYYDPTGQPADTVSARQARYRIDDRQVEFFGDTQVQLADGTRIFSEQAGADLVREEARIGGEFRFEKEDVHGRGEGLRYDFTGRELRIDNGLQLFSTGGSGETSGQSRRAVYRLRDQVLMLLDEAYLTDSRNRLDSDRIALHLDENQKLRKILASGQCRLQSGKRTFSGHQIDIAFDPTSRQSGWLQVLADTVAQDSQRATYSEMVGGVENLIVADRILGRPANSSLDGRLSLDGFDAQGDVRLRLPSLGIHDSEAGQVEAEYFPGQEHVRLVKLHHGVRVTRHLDSTRAGEERLQAGQLSLRFSVQQQLEEVWARENVHISIHQHESRRDLLARQSVQALYANGELVRVVSRGDSQLQLEGSEGQDSLKAPLIQMNYREGLLESLSAGQGVESVSERQGTVRRTSSKRLEIRYVEGKMESAIQTGDFHFEEGDPAVTDLRSERGIYVARTGKVRATGGPSPVLRSLGGGDAGNGIWVETVAREIELDQQTGSLLASGQVRSVVRDGENTTIVTSGKMEADPESSWIVYSIEPRVVQGTSSIAGETVRYNHSDQELVVENHVESRLLSKAARGDDYLVEAEKLVYRRQDLKAEYRGKVRVTSGELLVSAPAVNLFLSNSEPDQVEKLTAWGGVTIVDGGRHASGDRATHYPKEEKIVLTGDPAEVFELHKGKAIGRQLTFFVGEERLLVEGAP